MALNKIILGFELHTGLGPPQASKLLGIAYSSYAQYRTGFRDLPLYNERHIEHVMLLPASSLNAQIKKHIFSEEL